MVEDVEKFIGQIKLGTELKSIRYELQSLCLT